VNFIGTDDSTVGITNAVSSVRLRSRNDRGDVARDCFLNPIMRERFSTVGRKLTSAFGLTNESIEVWSRERDFDLIPLCATRMGNMWSVA